MMGVAIFNHLQSFHRDYFGMLGSQADRGKEKYLIKLQVHKIAANWGLHIRNYYKT